MGKVLKEVWTIYETDIPVFIYRERRRDNRISITKRGVNIRVPAFQAVMTDSWRKWAKNWLTLQIKKNPEIALRFSNHLYETGYHVRTPYRTYVLDIQRSDRATSTARLEGEVIYILLSQGLSLMNETKTIKTLVSRVIAKDQYDMVSKRIHEINDKCFKQPIKDIRLKNNSTNWGSCSSNGNINISTKTLMAPYEVQDYIFVHELAHRLEMNHSPRYWSIVRKVMPDYERHEKWLKEQGHTCEI